MGLKLNVKFKTITLLEERLSEHVNKQSHYNILRAGALAQHWRDWSTEGLDGFSTEGPVIVMSMKWRVCKYECIVKNNREDKNSYI